ncbi:interaptin-like isoform X3 [Triticum urartu]|nr:interaptin-like isoform X3 [Triticum urartu]
MDSAMLSSTCAGLRAPEEEDDDGGAVGYVKGEDCLGSAEAAAAGGLQAGLQVEDRVQGSGAHHRELPVRPQPRHHGRHRRRRLHGLSCKNDNIDNHPLSSDGETSQARKRRIKTKELPPVNLSPTISQHQETPQGMDSDDDTVGCMLRRIRKRLDGVSRKYDNNDNHPVSSDEETLQARKRRTKTKELSLENLSPIISQHQETSQGMDSDDETIRSVLRRIRKRLPLLSNMNDNGDNHQISSDEETLQLPKRRTETKELPLMDLSSSLSQHQDTSQGTNSDGETVGSMLRRIRKRLDGVSRKYDNNDNHPVSSDEETLQKRKRRTKTKELSLENLSPIISQHQETSQGTDSDDETIRSVLRRIRKRLPLLSNRNDNGDNHQISSDEETLQLPKRRTETKELPLMDLSPSLSQHQDTSQGTESDGETVGSMLRRIRKRLDGVSRKYDNNDNHPVSSDEETLQKRKRRTKTRELPLESLSPIISQHQETSQGTDSDDETIGPVLRTETKEVLLMDLSPSISQHQETSQGTDSDGETMGSMLRRIRERLDGLSRKYDNNDNHPISSDEETLQARKCRDTPLHPELNNNGVRAGEAELLDDLSEPELDDREHTEQRIIDDRDMSEPGDRSGASFSQKASLKRRHKNGN